MHGPNRTQKGDFQVQWRRFSDMTPLHNKQNKSSRIEWSNIWMKTLKKKQGSPKILNSYRGVFIVRILSIILEKLIKTRIMNTLINNISQFQNGGMKGKG